MFVTMKIWILILGIFWAGFSIPTQAQSIDQAISVKFIPQDAIDLQEETEYHYQGGQEIQLSFLIEYPQEKPLELQGEVNQVGFSMQIPNILEVKIQETGRKSQRIAIIDLPEVKRETVFELILKAKSEPESEWVESARAKIYIYPLDILKSLQEWSQGVQLRMDDREGNLKIFFDDHKVQYVDLKAALPLKEDQKIVTIIVADLSPAVLQDRQSHPDETLIIFREQKKSLPKIVVRPFRKGQLIDVSMVLIKNLSTPPIEQKMFL